MGRLWNEKNIRFLSKTGLFFSLNSKDSLFWSIYLFSWMSRLHILFLYDILKTDDLQQTQERRKERGPKMAKGEKKKGILFRVVKFQVIPAKEEVAILL